MNEFVVIRSGGDIGTAVACRLFRAGFKVLVLELEEPQAIRRLVSFGQAVFEKEVTVEGVTAVLVNSHKEISKVWDKGNIPLLVDPSCSVLSLIKPEVLVDAILAKKNVGTCMSMAAYTIGLGPGFKAGKDVDAVIETNRGHNLGRIIYEGFAEENTGVPGSILGFSSERVLRAPCRGIIQETLKIGDKVFRDDTVCIIDGTPVKASIDGIIRGLLSDGMRVHEGMKIGDIDPRGILEYCYTISDKGRTISGGVLEAILCWKNKNIR